VTFRVEHLNPSAMPSSAVFSQAVAVSGPARTIFVGGQNAVDVNGIVGHDLATQTTKALHNVELVLAEAGAQLADVVSWSIHVVDGQPLVDGFRAFQALWGDRGEPPAISVAVVAGLANPQFLVEISAVAVVPM
jgi:enamine deaminase RidA (YjgF/YER057c/UK114 family)